MKTVLFTCVHNSGRSQIAAAFFNALSDLKAARAVSAGTNPGDRVHPEVLTAMKAVGIDLSGAKPQRLTEELARGAALLITLGCGDQCPYIPGLRREDWPLEDPQGKSQARVDEIRNAIRGRVAELLIREGWTRRDPATAIQIRTASASERPAVEALLVANALPLEGLADHYDTLVVAIAVSKVVGAACVELHGEAALLRSVVVSEDQRGTGLGVRLTDAAIARAASAGARSVSLLTTTAAPFFLRRGFKQVEWAGLPQALAQSRELSGACPKSATAMHRPL